MRLPTNLDMDVLRTFCLGVALGGFGRAAERVGRSPSAVTLQIRKLEEQVGHRLFRKQGRGLVPTEAGETLLAYARRIIDLNDEAVAALRDAGVAGWVRVGVPQDLAEDWLPALLGRFAETHPNVRVEVRVERGSALVEGVERGALDLALAWGDRRSAHCSEILELPMVWIGREGFRRNPAEALALAAFDPPCTFRSAGTEALERAGIAWRHAFASPSLSGLWAAVRAGLGVTPRTAVGVPGSLRVLNHRTAGLPALPAVRLMLHAAEEEPGPAVACLRGTLLDTLALRLPAGAPVP